MLPTQREITNNKIENGINREEKYVNNITEEKSFQELDTLKRANSSFCSNCPRKRALNIKLSWPKGITLGYVFCIFITNGTLHFFYFLHAFINTIIEKANGSTPRMKSVISLLGSLKLVTIKTKV